MAPSFSITRWQKGIALIFGLSFIGLLIYNQQVPTAKIKIGGQNLTVLLAQTPARQYTGLGGRADLGKYDGMLFTFPVADKYAFVMRDMHFSIDIIWLNNGKLWILHRVCRLKLEWRKVICGAIVRAFPVTRFWNYPPVLAPNTKLKLGILLDDE